MEVPPSMAYPGMSFPVPSAASGMFDTRVFQHVLLAGPIVKFVLLVLVLFSVVSWAIIFLKFRLFKGIEKNQAEFAKAFAEGKNLAALYDQAEKSERNPLTEVFRTGYLELMRIQRSRSAGPGGATLAPVPPGIAEARIAPAAGLAAAIPSVMAYNFFLNRVRAIATRLASFSLQFVNFLRRNLEKG